MEQAGCAGSMRCEAARLAVALALIALPSFGLDRSFQRGLFHALPQDPYVLRLGMSSSGLNQSRGFCIAGFPAANSESGGFGSGHIQELGLRTRRAAALMPLDEAC
jgi:hypothetical protein